MIVISCLGCSLSNLPIGVLRCPGCGEKNFMPEFGTLSAPESQPEPINDMNNFCDTFTEQTGEAKSLLTGCSPNQHEETEAMWENINFLNEEHVEGIDGTNVKVKWSEGVDENNLSYENALLEQEQQLQICSNNPVLKNNAKQDITIAYDQAHSFNIEDHDVCVSGSVNVSACVSAHGEKPQNRVNISRQPQSKLENQSSVEAALANHDKDELSRYKNEKGYMHFGGCKKCLREYWEAVRKFNPRLQSRLDLKPYNCEKCLCSFDVRGRLKDHEIVHSEEKPFKCGQCPYTGKRKCNLKEHIETNHKKK